MAFAAAPCGALRLRGRAARTRRAPAACAAQGDAALRLEVLSARAAALRCPFWRRRATDAVDAAAATLAWVAATRHKSLGVAPARRRRVRGAGGGGEEEARAWAAGLDGAGRVAVLREDFVVRQYYVTGRLSEALYREDCVFDGPDPDVPVTGTAKYVDATGGLFWRPESRVELLGIGEDGGEVVAHWRLAGKLNLPWRPRIKSYTGSTRYFFDADGRIERHEETWAISALDAFASTLLPSLRLGAPEAPPADELLRAWELQGTPFDAYARGGEAG